MNRLSALCLLAFLLTMSGCKEEKTYRIGVSQCSLDDWRSKLNDEIQREIMFHDDAVVEIRSAGDDSRKQIEDIRYFADNMFDILIVAPNEAESLTPIIKDVYGKGMPVIIFDRNITGDTYTARLSVDNVELGRSAAHYALNMLGKNPKAIEIFGLKGSTPAEERHKGFMQEFRKGGGEILASVPADWNKEDAIPVADSLLRACGDVDLIYAHNDRMAIGAAEVAKRLGRSDIRIIGTDAAPGIGIQAVADGIIDATFLYPTEGHRLIRMALAILKGEPYEREVRFPVSSAVDKTNADILLMQNETLQDETAKMKLLKKQIDDYWTKHSSQTSLFYASIVIMVLLCGVLFLVLRAFWQRKRHQRVLMEQNRLLEEQRDMQKQLNEKLEAATHSKLVFFTNVSHDLRTPLTLIAEPVAQLASAENLTPQQNAMIRIADKNVRILRRLINQILDFRKYENGKLELRLSEVNFSSAVREWMESFYTIARKRDMRLSLDAQEDGDIHLALDAEKMERIFFNLLSNAFKYTPDNGTIRVSYHTEENRLIMKVSDTGEGISERDIGNIFDRFFQTDRVLPKGSGIGLSLVKAFVELHGGSISVESTLTKGSEFTVVIPVTHVTEKPAAGTKSIEATDVEAELDTINEAAAFDRDRELVLVIDDNADMRSLVGGLLGEEYNIITAPDGREGVRLAAKYVPDLVVCDVMMPVMDGLECCHRIKTEVSTSHIPVLMLTACAMDEQRVQGYENGADGYVSKPFNAEVLKARCRSLIDNRKRIKELWRGTASGIDGGKNMEETRETVPQPDAENNFYNRFVEIFRTQMGNSDLSVEQIAAEMGLGHSQFYRKIKALTNYSPVELMRQLRLKQARTLLTTTEMSVSEIAYKVGFSTPAYFTKCYKTAFGETPTELRERIGQKA
ncbi:MAG: substrate-binding domain-containing protein [Bacteroidales bacterium]|nr:substrate-binding domain-containing protein [Bacteroidales bacterium]MCM1146545.1 substrate-binding domain-containing protein [Bacteroidales bacterium]MCM1205937.1 substrate-binding domain-containing protein [Bacillota bacterium]MCM1510185.1 substrate-binding domain-containing protein [Clostridium sp.]